MSNMIERLQNPIILQDASIPTAQLEKKGLKRTTLAKARIVKQTCGFKNLGLERRIRFFNPYKESDETRTQYLSNKGVKVLNEHSITGRIQKFFGFAKNVEVEVTHKDGTSEVQTVLVNKKSYEKFTAAREKAYNEIAVEGKYNDILIGALQTDERELRSKLDFLSTPVGDLIAATYLSGVDRDLAISRMINLTDQTAVRMKTLEIREELAANGKTDKFDQLVKEEEQLEQSYDSKISKHQNRINETQEDINNYSAQFDFGLSEMVSKKFDGDDIQDAMSAIVNYETNRFRQLEANPSVEDKNRGLIAMRNRIGKLLHALKNQPNIKQNSTYELISLWRDLNNKIAVTVQEGSLLDEIILNPPEPAINANVVKTGSEPSSNRSSLALESDDDTIGSVSSNDTLKEQDL